GNELPSFVAPLRRRRRFLPSDEPVRTQVDAVGSFPPANPTNVFTSQMYASDPRAGDFDLALGHAYQVAIEHIVVGQLASVFAHGFGLRAAGGVVDPSHRTKRELQRPCKPGRSPTHHRRIG